MNGTILSHNYIFQYAEHSESGGHTIYGTILKHTLMYLNMQNNHNMEDIYCTGGHRRNQSRFALR